MSRKHYREVAEILQSAEDVTTDREALAEVARELALMFKRDNPRFDAGKFFGAAGFPELTGTCMGLN